MMTEHASRLTPEEADDLARLEAAFEAMGGRGVDLAERIDALRAKRDGTPAGDDFPTARPGNGAQPPVSTCCGASIVVTRVVRDVVTYEPVSVGDEGEPEPTLHVRFTGRTDPLDSDAYEAACDHCGVALFVDVVED